MALVYIQILNTKMLNFFVRDKGIPKGWESKNK